MTEIQREFQVTRQWTVHARNEDGEIEEYVNSMYEPPRVPIEPYPNPRITPTRARPRYQPVDGFETAMVLPDMQMGYRQIGEVYDPIHDEKALDVVLQGVKLIMPKLIILNGDNLDFPELSSFSQEKGFGGTTQLALNRMYRFLCELKANSPDSHIVWIEGNHEQRFQRKMAKEMLSLTGITRPDEETPVFSIQHLMRLEELDVEYIDGYPAGEYWLNDKLKAIHGNTVSSAGSTAARIAMRESVSVIFGHIHRREMHTRTVGYRDRAEEVTARSHGTLARIDGAVPSHGSGNHADGKPVPRYENWQQGFGVYHYHEDGRFWVEDISIDTHNGYETRYRDHLLTPSV